MRIDRYYASVREEVSPLSDDALKLLNRQDYVGFFKSCGANYVRGIRRAQEVTAIFTFLSPSKNTAGDFAAELQKTAVVSPTSTTASNVNTLGNIVGATSTGASLSNLSGTTTTPTLTSSPTSYASNSLSQTSQLFDNNSEARDSYRTRSRTSSFVNAQTRAGARSTTPLVSVVSEPKYDSITKSLEIKILGFGLGLNKVGSTTLVTNSLEEFDQVMKYAFQVSTVVQLKI